jgi:hypothetical protein
LRLSCSALAEFFEECECGVAAADAGGHGCADVPYLLNLNLA